MGEQTRKEQKDRKASAESGGSLLPADQNERFSTRW